MDRYEEQVCKQKSMSAGLLRFSDFSIYTAIYLLGCNCVRLKQCSYSFVTVYSDDPLEMALTFKEAGARSIHVVDLDAARTGVPANSEIISQIALASGLSVQTGGGIRNMDILDKVLDSGAARAILGTGAVRDKRFTTEALKKYGSRIIIGIDSRDGEVSVQGWTEGTGLKTVDFARMIESQGAVTIVYTDITRDGMLTGTQTDDEWSCSAWLQTM